MKYKIEELLDLDQMRRLLESYCSSLGIAAAIVDLKGNVLVSANWQSLCTDFYRINPQTHKKCIESDTLLTKRLLQKQKYSIYSCKNGLTDAASPIVIEGKHVANAFVGQFLLESPDRRFFRQQAAKYGFDEKDFLEALDEVPVVPKEKLPAILDFLTSFAEIVGAISLERLQQKDTLKALKEASDIITNSPAVAFLWRNAAGWPVEYVSDNVKELFNYTAREFLAGKISYSGLVHPDDLERVGEEVARYSKDKRRKRFIHQPYRIIDRKGKVKWVDDRTNIRRDSKGRITHYQGVVLDITDQIKAREALRESEKKNRAMIETSKDWIWSIDLQGRHTYCSPAVENILGYKPAEFLYNSSLLLMHEEDRELVKTNLPDWIKNKSGWNNLLIRWKHKDGRYRYLESNSVPVLSEGGDVIGFQGVDRDITDRKKAEEELLKSSIIINSTSDAVVTCDTDGRISFWNKGAERIYGYKQKEILGKPISILYKKEDLHVLEGMISDLMKGKDIPGIEVTCIDKNRNEIHILLSLTTIKDEKGNVRELVGITKDVSERKQAEEALRESEGKYRSLYENALVAMFRTSIEDGRALATNDVAVKLYGYSSKEEFLAEYKASEHYLDPDERKRLLDELKAKGQVSNFEIRFTRKDGTVFWEEISAKIYPEEGYIEGCVIDITERVEAERALRRERDRAQRYLDVAGVMLLVLDKKGKVSRINRKGCEILGYSEHEVVGKKWFDNFLPKKLKPEGKKVFSRLIAGDIMPVEYYENPVLTKSGEERIIAWYNSIIKNEKGELLGILSSGEDITERKRTEDALRQSEERYRRLIDNSLVGIGISERNTVLFANPALLKIFGYSTLEEYALVPLLDHVAPSSRVNIEALMKKKGKLMPYEFEYDIVRKDGEIRTLQASSNELITEGKSIRYTTFIDITERKKAEEALRQSEERFRELAEMLPQIVFETDEKGFITFVNNQALEMLGYSREEYEKNKFFCLDILVPSDRKRAEQNLNKIIKGDLSSGNEYMAVRKDGTKFPVMVQATRIEREGKFVGLRGCLFDITAQKDNENALRQERSRLVIRLKYERLLADTASRLNTSPVVEKIMDELLEKISNTMELDIASLFKSENKNRVTERRNIWYSRKARSLKTDILKTVPQVLIPEGLGPLNHEDTVQIINYSETGRNKRDLFGDLDIGDALVCRISLTDSDNIFLVFGRLDERKWKWKSIERETFRTISHMIAGAWERSAQIQARLEAEKKQTEAVRMAEEATRLASMGVMAGELRTKSTSRLMRSRSLQTVLLSGTS